MKLLLAFVLSFSLGTAANAAGLSFAVGSLDQAKKVVQQERGKHILVFYSSPN